MVHCVWHNKCGSTEELLIAAAFMSSLCLGTPPSPVCVCVCVLSITAALMFSLCWGPSQCVSIVAAFTYYAWDPPSVCCPLLQQSHLDSITYSGADNYVCVVFDKPQKRTLVVEAFSHAAPNFQAA